MRWTGWRLHASEAMRLPCDLYAGCCAHSGTIPAVTIHDVRSNLLRFPMLVILPYWLLMRGLAGILLCPAESFLGSDP